MPSNLFSFRFGDLETRCQRDFQLGLELLVSCQMPTFCKLGVSAGSSSLQKRERDLYDWAFCSDDHGACRDVLVIHELAYSVESVGEWRIQISATACGLQTPVTLTSRQAAALNYIGAVHQTGANSYSSASALHPNCKRLFLLPAGHEYERLNDQKIVHSS
jgi:hypothetical protein